MKRILLLTALLSFFASSFASSFAYNWQPVVEMDNRLFASYVYATGLMDFNEIRNLTADRYYRGDEDGQLGVVFKKMDNAALPKISVIVEGNEFMQRSSYEGYLLIEPHQYEIFPEIAYNYPALQRLNQSKMITVTFRLSYNNGPYETKSVTVKVHPIQDCPFLFQHRSNVMLDQNWMYAAYVNEQHPSIANDLLPATTKKGLVSRHTGYQTGDSDEVHRQVLALWAVLRDRKFHYSSIAGHSYSNSVAYQYIRTHTNMIRTGQANCVDGTVMMSSVLLSMGIEPILALTPNHCFLGFYLGNGENASVCFLETTMLDAYVNANNVDKQLLTDIKGLYMPVSQILFSDYLTSYAGAVQVGNQNFLKDKDKFLDTSNINYQLVDVASWRRKGVESIGR